MDYTVENSDVAVCLSCGETVEIPDNMPFDTDVDVKACTKQLGC